ncbi:MAG: SAM-dependent methyltransferase, partial [Peptococcaceae bacterium]|nr:SAM-dependent methyltransferase [Peptococcaceae bacterium]
DILQKVSDSLKANGVLYVSFKYGDYAGWRNGRYFTNLTEQTLGELLERIPSLRLVETSVTGDVRPGREQELWLNAIVEKI